MSRNLVRTLIEKGGDQIDCRLINPQLLSLAMMFTNEVHFEAKSKLNKWDYDIGPKTLSIH